MVVHSGNVKVVRPQFRHDGIQFFLEQHQVAHHHGVVVGSEESRPRAQRQSWLDRQSVNGNVEIGPGKTHPVSVTRLLARPT